MFRYLLLAVLFQNLFLWTSGKDNDDEDEPQITVSFNSLEAHPDLRRAVRYLKRDSSVLLYRFHTLMKNAKFHIISFHFGDRLTANYALKGVDCTQFINFLLLSAKGVYHIRDAFVVCNEKEVNMNICLNDSCPEITSDMPVEDEEEDPPSKASKEIRMKYFPNEFPDEIIFQ
ncbi:hypothetical protein RB195_012112 [Necator americanus]|uniref:Uncharacterized protein n=1 Tax=Necator americanus TaxID=51031 RepID=A0ABR1D8Q9_NECAM